MMKNPIRQFLDNCGRFTTAIMRELSTTRTVDPCTITNFHGQIWAAQAMADNLDTLVKAARAASSRLTQIGQQAEQQWEDAFIRRPLDIFIEECLFELPYQPILDLDAALKPFQDDAT